MKIVKALYKSLGHELMTELEGLFGGAELIAGGDPGVYEILKLPGEMSVRFTSWRGGDGPFYIILFKGAKYVFELDLSMIVYDRKRFTWHLKIPSHKNNLYLLDDFLEKAGPLSREYSESVKNVKEKLESGVNTPRTGYRFLEEADWDEVCERFSDLMRRVIKAHSVDANSGQLLREAEDDDGYAVNAMRKARRSQSKFRLNMMYLYCGRCAISGEMVTEVLEAAHIVGHAEAGINHTENGLLLRSDIHRLFDAGRIAIDPKSLKVVVCRGLEKTMYQKFSGWKLRSRIDGSSPRQEYLEIRWARAIL